MKKIGFIIGTFCFVQFALGQNIRSKNYSIGVFLAKSDFIGDQDVQTLKFSNFQAAYGANFCKEIHKNVDLGINMAFGKWGARFNRSMGPLHGSDFYAKFGLIDLNMRVKSLKFQTSNIIPFFTFGIGIRHVGATTYVDLPSYGAISPSHNNQTSEIIVPLGIGFLYKINSNLGLQYQYTFGITSTDGQDFKVDKVNFLENDFYGLNQLGITYTFDFKLKKCSTY